MTSCSNSRVEDDDGLTECQIVTPGERLASCVGFKPGPGTYTERGYIYSSTTGRRCDARTAQGKETEISVSNYLGNAVVPTTGSIVIAQVTRTQQKLVTCDILCANGCILKQPYRGQIRLQDVRQFEVDKIEMLQCFRPTDLIRARVISVSLSTYLLSTAEESLGVIVAESSFGGRLQPVSWQLMACSKTGQVEERHVAKPEQ